MATLVRRCERRHPWIESATWRLAGDGGLGVVAVRYHQRRTIDFSETPTGPYAPPPPLVGEHTHQILLRLGYSDEEIDRLIARGVVYEPDDDYPRPM